MGIDWRLRVCWLVVLRQVFVGMMCFGGDGFKKKPPPFKKKPPYGGAELYQWKMRMIWMLTLRDFRVSRKQIFFINWILLSQLQAKPAVRTCSGNMATWLLWSLLTFHICFEKLQRSNHCSRLL